MAAALHWSGTAPALRALLGSNGPLVVGYHRVVEDFDAAARHALPSMLISRAMLERQLDWIGRRYRVVSLGELGRELERGEVRGRPAAAITFDDGYRDVYDHAFPLLARMGMPAAVFVVTDLVGTSELQTHDRLHASISRALMRWGASIGPLERHLLRLGIRPERCRTITAGDAEAVTRRLLRSLSRPHLRSVLAFLEAEAGRDEERTPRALPLTWEMVREMHRAGMTIGSHTRSHALLTNESPGSRSDEIDGSRRELEAGLGAPVAHFAYPDGRFNRAAVRAVAAAGFRFGYTTCRHRDAIYPQLTIPRCLLWERSSIDATGGFSPAIMSCQSLGLMTGRPSCTQWAHG